MPGSEQRREASSVLLNIILGRMRNKGCSTTGLSESVLNKHSTSGMKAGPPKETTSKKIVFIWMRRFWLDGKTESLIVVSLLFWSPPRLCVECVSKIIGWDFKNRPVVRCLGKKTYPNGFRYFPKAKHLSLERAVWIKSH